MPWMLVSYQGSQMPLKAILMKHLDSVYNWALEISPCKWDSGDFHAPAFTTISKFFSRVEEVKP